MRLGMETGEMGGSEDCPKQRAAVLEAVRLLTEAGMVVRYVTRFGHSHYLGWPGRSGTLRVSDHQTTKREDAHIYARITFHAQSVPGGAEKMERVVAEALGRYLMKAPAD